MNFEEEVQCPYDKSHQIRKKRLTKHLIACRRNHPDVVKVTCPFNNDHILNPQELDHHVTMCTDRKSFETFRTIFKIPITPTQEPNMPEYQSEENWDAELGTSSYNPQQYVKNAAVIRNIIGAPPRERKKFRLEEHLRLQGMLNPK